MKRTSKLADLNKDIKTTKLVIDAPQAKKTDNLKLKKNKQTMGGSYK